MKYHVYVLNRRFQVLKGRDLEARDDVSALEQGIMLSKAEPVEIWQRSRLVARIGMDGEAIPGRSKSSPAHRACAA